MDLKDQTQNENSLYNEVLISLIFLKMAAPGYNVFVGAETGLLKGVNISKKTCENVNNIHELSREKQICVMCWKNHEETTVSFGLSNRSVQEYDLNDGEISTVLECTGGEGPLKGLCCYGSSYVTCVESGLVKIWNEGESQAEFTAGANICRMRQNPSKQSSVATGGKENDLKVWDLEKYEEPIFKAKNVAHDWLNLRVPVWVSDVTFIPDSNKLVTATGHHQIRVYDMSAQRRPVLDMNFDEYPITAISLTSAGNQVVVGNTHGGMALVDLRQGKMVQRYKGFSGGIRCVECHPTLPLIASCGLDRFLRIHELNTKHLLHKFYLKSRLNCLLLKTDWDQEGTQEDLSKEIKESKNPETNQNCDDSDELWDSLQVVGKKRKLKDNEKPVSENKTTQRKSRRGKKIGRS